MDNIEALRYPIGRFQFNTNPDAQTLESWIDGIADFPRNVEELLSTTDPSSIHTARYRPGGWTIAQVVNHCCDSHMNSLMRFKLGLTEEDVTVRTYLEAAWAELPDGDAELETALSLLKGLHAKWSRLLRGLNEAQWQRTVFHPEHQRKLTLIELAGLYDWHCRHHLEHIKLALAHPYNH